MIFDRPILLRQTSTWSRGIAWSIIGMTAFTVIWASVFKIDEAVPVTGKLEPKGTVTDIQAPVGGVVKKIHAAEGQKVKLGETLITLEQTNAVAQVASLEKNRIALLEENNYYRRQIQGDNEPSRVKQHNLQLRMSPEIASLTESRAAIVAENELYYAQLRGSTEGATLTPEQQLRLRSRLLDVDSRVEAAKLEIGQSQQLFLQNQAELISAKKVLTINQKILNDLKPLMKRGAFPRLQFLKQEQDVQTQQAQVQKLIQEQQRLKLAIAQANAKLNNTLAQSKEDLLARITANDKSIAEIDSQITKMIVDNQKKLNEIESQLAIAKTNLKYQQISSPVEGTIFDLKAKASGFVVNSSEPIMKIVPNENLIAKVYVTNRDIGFVKEGQQVDVRIDSFPFQQYGDVKGELLEIGSDALPPDQVYPYWRFPAKVRLKQQTVLINGREVPLQSGMSINANIKLRQRTIMSIFTDFLVQKAESLKFVR